MLGRCFAEICVQGKRVLGCHTFACMHILETAGPDLLYRIEQQEVLVPGKGAVDEHI